MAEVAGDDIRSQVRAVLAHSGIYDLRNLEVQQQDGRLILSGSVSRFYYKQLAQELVQAVCRDVGLVNSIRVR